MCQTFCGIKMIDSSSRRRSWHRSTVRRSKRGRREVRGESPSDHEAGETTAVDEVDSGKQNIIRPDTADRYCKYAAQSVLIKLVITLVTRHMTLAVIFSLSVKDRRVVFRTSSAFGVVVVVVERRVFSEVMSLVIINFFSLSI